MDFIVNAKTFGDPLHSDDQLPSFFVAHPGAIYMGDECKSICRFPSPNLSFPVEVENHMLEWLAPRI
jgi:hypothetical protein